MTQSLNSMGREDLARQIEQVVQNTPVLDIHTHLYDPAFGELLLWGIDDLLVYHYLIAEVFRFSNVPYEQFWRLNKTEQANLIWNELFLKHSPVSEACRGVLTTLQLLGLEVRKRDLASIRKWFSNWKVEDYLGRCLELAGLRKICMTNSPFDDVERPVWQKGFSRDDRFIAALRIDPLLVAWPQTAPLLRSWGYETTPELSDRTVSEVQRFLRDWTQKMKAQYLMVSLPPDFAFPGPDDRSQLIERAILPHCRETGLPFALMIGVKRAQNPALRLAGDGVGQADLGALANLCAQFPDNKFLATLLSRENQHELAVLGRKFRNLHIFGCWWFMNIPHVVDEITRMRLELLGLSFTPQHSDARVLDQVVYKWAHFRRVLAGALTDKYADLAATGWEVPQEDLQRDVRHLLGGEFERFCQPVIN